VNGVTVNAMDEVLTHMKGVLSMRANGKIAKKMGMVLLDLQMGVFS
jgi:hypothetical protein